MEINTNLQKWKNQPTGSSGFNIPYAFRGKKTKKRRGKR